MSLAPRRLFAGLPLRRPAPPQAIPAPAFPIDVVVPVFRGFADTVRCIDSVLASPQLSAYRLIVINDASPEPELAAWLRQRAAEDPRVLLLENRENLGFVHTVNRGMSLSDTNDVLILNSDTEVANDWMDRLRAAAYGDTRVATVTPFSNNATICSYPRFCKDNLLPDGYDTKRLDALCSRILSRSVVNVPTGVGFCMYIRRDSLRELGLLDTEHFGKGYGEENDFCQRALKAGWRNLHLLDTFVLHTGSVSFGGTRHERQEAGLRAMARLHPGYQGDVTRFINADPARPARLALDIARIRESGLPVVLAVTHSRAGGTIRHVMELAGHLAGKASFLILTPATGRRVVLRSADSDGFQLEFRLPAQFDALVKMLRAINTSHVHFHHLLGHVPEVRELPRLLGVAHDFTVHDFYGYCTRISLTDKSERYAGQAAPGQCNCCDPEMRAPRDWRGTVASWRSANARLLREARHVFAPSRDAADRIRGLAHDAPVLVASHVDVPGTAALPVPAPAAIGGERLKVVLIGALSGLKGADVLEATALEAARMNSPIEFHLLGHAYRPLKAAVASGHLTVHGEYEEQELPSLLGDLAPHLAWFPAQGPETYSYTLSAVLKAGLPVLVSDLGALPERVQGRAWSWIRPWNASPSQWLNDLLAIRQRHFLSGMAPRLDEAQGTPAAASPSPQSPWNYRDDYLVGISPRPSAIPMPQPEDLAPHAYGSGMNPHLWALSILTYLRFHPLLQTVAHAVPTRWRQRISDWLSA